MYTDHAAHTAAGTRLALLFSAIIQPRGDARPELERLALALDEQLGYAAAGEQCGFADEEAAAGPVVFGMAEELDAAHAALHHFDIVALIFEQVPERGHRGQAAVAD